MISAVSLYFHTSSAAIQEDVETVYFACAALVAQIVHEPILISTLPTYK